MARAVIVVVLAACLAFTSDEIRLNPVQEAAAPHLYSLVRWEAENFLDKWVHRAASVLPWNRISGVERQRMVGDYFALSLSRSEIVGRLEDAIARGASEAEFEALQIQIDAIDRSRLRLRAEVEEALEAAISAILGSQGLATAGDLLLPPVDFRLEDPPFVLITSPRDRIARGQEALLRPETTLSDSVRLEEDLMRQRNVSALVIRIGGLATYPASVYGNLDLRWTLQTAAHEWMHHRLFFGPLGFGMMESADMQMLNETVANVAGREIGDMAFVMFGGEVSSPDQSARKPTMPAGTPDFTQDGEFNFGAEMRTTRLRVDWLLSQGKIEEAEEYMEKQRLVFVENGHNIRKLNQAYFAFYGTYADSAASSSPIGDQVIEFRNLSPNLGTFISRMSSFGSYSEFLEELAALRVIAR